MQTEKTPIISKDKDELKAALEAILFISGEAVSHFRLANTLNITSDELDELIMSLQEDLQAKHRGLALVKIAGGYRLCTKIKIAPYLEKFTQVVDKKLSQPIMETLSIIAFKQPVTKQEIEEIRGVNTDKILRRLLERDLIQEVGRKKVIGRPILYGTTSTFLQCFGLNDIKDLPELPNMSYEEREKLYQEANLFSNEDLKLIKQLGIYHGTKIFTSGEFAKFCNTTKDTLFHYDDINLLKPAKIAPNGYRIIISCNQAFLFDMISLLKEVGLSLEEIKIYMDNRDAKTFYPC